jgi:hypothetical protein
MDAARRLEMTLPNQKNLTLLAVWGLAYWFFGNLYEAIVFSPNWVVDSPAQIKRLNEFFINTSPTTYFVIVTQLATLTVWLLLWLNRERGLRRDYRRAGFLALAAALLNVYIVAVLIRSIFGHDSALDADRLHTYLWRWNALNLLRMALVAATAVYLFSAFRKLDRGIVVMRDRPG